MVDHHQDLCRNLFETIQSYTTTKLHSLLPSKHEPFRMGLHRGAGSVHQANNNFIMNNSDMFLGSKYCFMLGHLHM